MNDKNQAIANCRGNVFKLIGEAFNEMNDMSRMSLPKTVAEQLEIKIFKEYKQVAKDIQANKDITVEEALAVLRKFWVER